MIKFATLISETGLINFATLISGKERRRQRERLREREGEREKGMEKTEQVDE